MTESASPLTLHIIRIFETALEALVAKALTLDDETRTALAELGEFWLVVEATPPGVLTAVRFEGGHVEVGPANAIDAQATVRGSPAGLAMYFSSWIDGTPEATPDAAQHVQIEGERETLRRIENVFRGFEPDWEEPLSRVVGDIPARHIGVAVRGLHAFGLHAVQRLRATAEEYFRYDTQAVPSRVEWNMHRDRLAHLHARIDALTISAASMSAGSVDVDTGQDGCAPAPNDEGPGQPPGQ
ncbi:MAG: ubiquinone biosynthesis protein UbiJ [Gammaproteobacteria bacterium]|jgi:ubiquinone biosynthesis protein UbiJ